MAMYDYNIPLKGQTSHEPTCPAAMAATALSLLTFLAALPLPTDPMEFILARPSAAPTAAPATALSSLRTLVTLILRSMAGWRPPMLLERLRRGRLEGREGENGCVIENECQIIMK